MPGLLSQSELQYMRDLHEDNLPQTCTIQRLSIASDSQGGQTETWTNTYTQVPCRISQRRGREEILPDRWTEYSQWVLTVAHDQDLIVRDRVVVDSVTFEVRTVDVGKGYNLAKRAELEKIS